MSHKYGYYQVSGWGFETLRTARMESHVFDIRKRSAVAVLKILNADCALCKLPIMLARVQDPHGKVHPTNLSVVLEAVPFDKWRFELYSSL